MNTPELLAPAGSLSMLQTALDFGADAVYAGQPRYSLRVRNNEFDSLDALSAAMALARSRGKRFYLVSNVYPRNAKLPTYVDDVAPVVALQPDALIVSDPGLIDLLREHWPDVPLHLSVQANTMNWRAVRFWQRQGIQRVILSRELSLDEIEEIRQRCPDIELEVFIHGALCIAHSGRCLISAYMTRREANQGACANSCRWRYRVLEEESRPGESIPIEEDEHGTYLLNSRDLRAVEHVGRLLHIGVDSLKIEGRTKSPYYAARTCQTYRQAIDDALAGRPFSPSLFKQLDTLANRGYTDGFFQRHAPAAYQNYEQGHSESQISRYVGDALSFNPARGLMEVRVRNRFAVGDVLEAVHPSGNVTWTLNRMEDANGQAMPVAPGNTYHVWLDMPAALTGAFIARFAS